MTANDNVEKTLALIERNAARYLAEFQRYLRQPAISSLSRSGRISSFVSSAWSAVFRAFSAPKRLLISSAGSEPSAKASTSR